MSLQPSEFSISIATNKKGENKVSIIMNTNRFVQLVRSLKHTDLNHDLMNSFEKFLKTNEEKYDAIKGLAEKVREEQEEAQSDDSS